MSLALTSDESLCRILHFTTAGDILRLILTGSKRMMARVAQNAHTFDFKSPRPTFFPFSCYQLSLRTLIIHAPNPPLNYGHLSLNGRAILPLEPIKTLETLDLDFQLSHRIFDLESSGSASQLSSSFPHLTSLSVRGVSQHPLPDGWAESLPQSLKILKLSLETWDSEYCPDLDPIMFESLPSGLQTIEFGYYMTIGEGKVNLKRFEDLRALRLSRIASWEVLETLPDTLEELILSRQWVFSEEPETVFPLSKLPPKIRLLDLSGMHLRLDLDCPVPDTLEELCLDRDIGAIEIQDLEQFFNTKNLLRIQLDDVGNELFDIAPNLKDYGYSYVDLQTLQSLEILPRKITKLALLYDDASRSSHRLEHLPPSLEELDINMIGGSDLTLLPKTLISLFISKPLGTLDTSSLHSLSDRLTKLSVPLKIFESERCLEMLPGTIELLRLNLSDCKWLNRLSFPSKMQNSLKTLYMTDYSLSEADLVEKSLQKWFKDFKTLSTLFVDSRMTLRYDTLRNLPSSLTYLSISCNSLMNYGLPDGKSLEENTDWKEGAFSHLPAGLESLEVDFMDEDTASVDYMVFSMLPARLASIYLSCTVSRIENPKALVATLPKRISAWSYICPTFDDYDEESNPELYEAEQEKNAKHASEVEEALKEYYADPFWDGFYRSI